MADTTVKQLAQRINRSVETLVAQMQEAGLTRRGADDLVTDAEQQQLLSHLKRSHGGATADDDARQISLKRKTVSTIKTTPSTGGKAKTVSVEVRKTRTFVKPSDEAAAQDAARKAEEAARLAADAAEAARRQVAEEAARQAAVSAPVAGSDPSGEMPAAGDAPRKAAESGRDKKLNVPKPATVKKSETPEQRAQREAEEARRRAADEARKAQETTARKAAEEKARLRTLEQAQKIAADLAARPDSGAAAEDVPLARGLVGRAFEDSFAKEDREIRRGGNTSRGGKNKGGKKREEEHNYRPAQRALSSALSKQHGFEKPVEKQVYKVKIAETILVADLAQQMAVKAKEVTRVLMKMGEVLTPNQPIDQATAALVVEEMGHQPEYVSSTAMEDSLKEHMAHDGEGITRPPVVTIMGHVDHGKTSLLDYIRRAKVASGEAGGITQHIGAYHVTTPRGVITFLDTPGHAAFTSMRARGAKATDIVVLVVAADDGVMPQTVEAIDHARAAGVPIIVAINKMDKESADPDRVLNELTVKQVVPEEWGGDTPIAKVSAHSGQGIDELLEIILIQAELLELTAVEDATAQGVVIEARVEKGRGAVATVLVQKGTLRTGDLVLAGQHYGRVRAMIDEVGKPTKSAGPSIPVEILGLPEAPNAGDEFMVVDDERKAREVAEFRTNKERQAKMELHQGMKLENLFATMGKQEVPSVNIVLKTDVRGSLEAIAQALNDLSVADVRVRIVSSGVGAITESDVNLAESTGAVILGFNVRADNAARLKCQQDEIDLRYYSVIYEMIDDVKAAMSGLLSPEHREHILGVAQVRNVFRSSRFGAAAGCMVLEGIAYRNKPIRVLRDEVVVFQGELESLRRFKDDVHEVRHGMECGMAVKGYNDIREGDKIEVYEVHEIKRTL